MRYLVETYLPSTVDPASAEPVAHAADVMGAVRYVDSLFVPADEVCFHVFEAPSAEALQAVLDDLHIAYERIMETASAIDSR